jgi:hypothetical protein
MPTLGAVEHQLVATQLRPKEHRDTHLPHTSTPSGI